MAYVPNIRAYFWGEWEFQPIMPSIVLGLLFSNFVVNLICSAPLLKWWNFLTIPLFIFFGALFTYAYIRVIKDGPGYFPFYWSLGDDLPLDDHPDPNTPLNAVPPSGIISTQAQEDWSRSHQKPGRSIVSASAHRIVLRPDHLCGWTTVWIGKRNFKFFILFNFYGVFYMLTSMISGAYGVYKLFGRGFGVLLVLQGIFVILSLVFFLLTASFVFSGFRSALTGQTSWEEWNGIDAFDMGRQKNLEDALGPGPKWKWLLPISPWEGFSNQALADQYSAYIRDNYHADHPTPPTEVDDQNRSNRTNSQNNFGTQKDDSLQAGFVDNEASPLNQMEEPVPNFHMGMGTFVENDEDDAAQYDSNPHEGEGEPET